MKEDWREIIIDSIGSAYQVSNTGKVKNAKTGKMLKPSVNVYGYSTVNLSIGGKSKVFFVHRLVALMFIGASPIDENGKQYDVNHKDLVRSNNLVDNLEYMTRSQNIRHSHRMNPYWERESSAKNISPDALEWIKEYSRKKREKEMLHE